MQFATIGTSWITALFIEAAKQSGEAELAAVYSRSAEQGQAFAEAHDAKSVYTDLDAMLASPCDFIYIASPNALHFEHALKCIEHQKHVFCEKPFVYTEAQLKTLREAATRENVFLFEGFRHLFTPNYHILKEALPQIGQVRSALLQFVQYSSKYDAVRAGDTPNVFNPEYAGGALMDLGVYPLSMTIDLFGEPEAASYFPVKLENGIDASGTLVLTYDGFQVTILCSKVAQATAPSEIHGEDGTLTLDHLSPLNTLSLYNHRTKERKNLSRPLEVLDMTYEIQAFITMIREHDTLRHEAWLDRSQQVVRLTERLRRDADIVFPDE